jgi:rfaE bifunctional protein nucleotidyltransferase chain/domain
VFGEEILKPNKMRVWVNGTFDVLHRGHFELLEWASRFGDLRVGIDFDSRVKELKGEDRPVNKWIDRVYAITSIKGVDSAVGFATDEELIEAIIEWKPDVMVVGSDYKDKRVIGSEHAGELVFFDRIEGYSSTNIINYAHNSNR